MHAVLSCISLLLLLLDSQHPAKLFFSSAMRTEMLSIVAYIVWRVEKDGRDWMSMSVLTEY